jgi:predicted Fe-Mo cluster-binding NifX family protein
MKVAIAKDGEFVSEHFGHCQEYRLYTVDDGKITLQEDLVSPGHEPGRLPALLAEHKVTHVIAGGMGPKAIDLFCAHNIEVFIGIGGPVDEVIQGFLAGTITPGQSSCHHPQQNCDH